MGLLGDIYSAIDTKKRQLKGLLGDVGGTVDMGARRFREDQQGLQNLFANAYPMSGDRTVLNSPQQIAQFQREAADKAGEMGLAGVVGYHGTMTPNFDKFNLDHFGKTDEGWLGKGIYAAKSPIDASNYAMVGGKPGGAVFKVDMDLKNPLTIDWEAANKSELLAKRRELGPDGFSAWLKSMGHDGVVFNGPLNALNSALERDVQYMAIDPAMVQKINY